LSTQLEVLEVRALKGRRNTRTTHSLRNRVISKATAFQITAVTLIALALIGLTSSLSRAQTPTRREIDIKAFMFGYDPSEIVVNQGDTVLIRFSSLDVSHGFYIDGYEIKTEIIQNDGAESNETRELMFVADKAGVFRFRCTLTCGYFHPFMIGKLRVEPANQFLFSSILAVAAAFGLFAIMVPRSKVYGNPDPSNPYLFRFDLLKIGIVNRLLKLRSWQFWVQYPNLLFFILVILTGVFGTQVGNKNLSIMFVWILWWAALMLFLVPVLARFWCMICPLPSFGEWTQRGTITGKKEKRFGLNLKWPKKLDNIWIQNLDFLATSMFIGILITRPWATGYLMVLLIATPLILSLVFKDRVFCRYICPVAGFIGLYSMFSTLELRVRDRKVCLEHPGKECIKGSDKGYGCPWLEFPQNMNRNAYCGLCTECLKTCPKDNTTLYLRMGGEDLYVEPWHGIKKRGFDEAWKAFIMATLAFLYGLTFMGPYSWLKDMANMASLPQWGSFAVLVWGSTLVAFPAVYFVFIALSKLASRVKEMPLKKLFINYSYTLVPMGLLAWIAFSIAILFINGSYIIAVISDPFGWGWDLFGTKHFAWQPFLSGLVPYLQVLILIVGLIFALRTTIKISMRTFTEKTQAVRASIPVGVMHVGYTVLLLWLWVG